MSGPYDNIPGYEPLDDTLVTYCWCARRAGPVPRKEVLAGKTKSCGLPNCKEQMI